MTHAGIKADLLADGSVRVFDEAGRSTIVTGGATAVKGITRGATLIATGNAMNYGQPNFASIFGGKKRHVALSACSDIRFVYGPPLGVEVPLSNPVIIKAGIEAVVGVTVLSSALSTAAAITSIPVSAVGGAAITSTTQIMIPSGSTLTISDTASGRSQTWTTTANVVGAATAIAVTSQRPDFAYPKGAQVSASLVYPVTFDGGKQTALLEPPTGMILSDPVPLELAAGQVFYSRTTMTTPFGAATTLAALSSIADTALTVTAAPPTGFTYPQQMVVDSSTNREIVTVTGVTGSGPYTYALAAAMIKAHSNGVAFGQQLITNTWIYSDKLESGTTTDLAWNLFPSVINAGKTTSLNADCVAGDVKVNLPATAAITSLPFGPIVIDTGGTPETINVRNVTPNGATYDYWLETPLQFNHSSGAVVTGIAYSNIGAPLAVVADHVTSPVAPVIVLGDSIVSGSHWISRNDYWTYTSQALEGFRPYLSGALNSDGAFAFIQPNNSMNRRRLFDLVGSGWVIVEYGINDLHTLNFTDLQLRAWITTLIGQIKQRGSTLKVVLTTVLPYSSSTDGFLTVVNQTIGQVASEPYRVAYNTWIRAGAPGSGADLVLDTASAVESSLNSGLWLGSGAYGPICYDGTHPSQQGHMLIAAKLTALLPQMVLS